MVLNVLLIVAFLLRITHEAPPNQQSEADLAWTKTNDDWMEEALRAYDRKDEAVRIHHSMACDFNSSKNNKSAMEELGQNGAGEPLVFQRSLAKGHSLPDLLEKQKESMMRLQDAVNGEEITLDKAEVNMKLIIEQWNLIEELKNLIEEKEREMTQFIGQKFARHGKLFEELTSNTSKDWDVDEESQHGHTAVNHNGAQRPHVEVIFNACSRWHADAGVGGRIAVGDLVTVNLWLCGLASTNVACILDPLKRFLLLALGPLDVLRFAAAGSGTDEKTYLQLFAQAAATYLARHASNGCSAFVFCSNERDSRQHFLTQEDMFETVLLDALAAASGAAIRNMVTGEDPQDDLERTNMTLASADHRALAHVTKWLRRSELMYDVNKYPCFYERELHGYNCLTFTYGSTFFQSWLQVMRFPAVDRALSFAKTREGQEVVVLGSSLGWQTLWTALTFGIQSVGYEILKGRVDVARSAALEAEAAATSAEFRHADVLQANVSLAAVIYATDLAWEENLQSQVADLIRSQLLATEGHGEGVVIISNDAETWHRKNFSNLGHLVVPVSWTRKQSFYFWTV